jgi:hypothetical protein
MMKPSPRLPLVPFALAGWLAVAVSLLVHACNSSAQTASAVQVEVRLLSGETLRGELVSVNEKEAVFQTGKDRITKALGELLSITFPASGSKTPVAADAPRTELRLLDGTTLLAQKFSLKQKQVECQLFNGQAVSVPLNRLHWLLVTAQEEKAREELQQALAKKHAQDVVLLLSRDGQAINTFLGVVLGGDEQGARLNFRLEDDVVPIDMARLRGLVLAQRERTGSSDGVRVQDRFGNTWLAAEITWEANRLRLRTGDGLTAELTFDQLASVDFSQGRLVYLSDLEPLRVEEKPLLADVWRFRRDRNLSGGPISLGQKMYSKGITVHSRTVLEYEVAGYREFRCVLGMEDSVNVSAQAVVRIEGDGRELFHATIRTGDKPREVRLNLENVERLRLVVDYGDDLDLGDHVAFAEARLLK